MRLQPFLTIKKNGSVRITKSAPALGRDEITMRLNINIPDKIFLKPRLEASITVPEDSIQAAVIEPEVVDNIKETIKEHTGIELDIKVIPVETED